MIGNHMISSELKIESDEQFKSNLEAQQKETKCDQGNWRLRTTLLLIREAISMEEVDSGVI